MSWGNIELSGLQQAQLEDRQFVIASIPIQWDFQYNLIFQTL